MYKTQKDLQQRSHHAWPQIPIDPRVSHSSQAQKPKHAPPKDPMVAAFDNTRSYSWSRAHTLPAWLPAFSHTLALIHVPSAHDVMDDVILHYLGLTRIDLET